MKTILFLLSVLCFFNTLLPAQIQLVGFSNSASDNDPTAGGSIWRLDADGSNFQIIKAFDATTDRSPETIFLGSDGYYYGVLRYGGQNDRGSVFRISPDGSDFQVIWHFPQSMSATRVLRSAFEGSDGKLYFAMSAGGASDLGLVFRLDKDGSAYETLNDQHPPKGLLTEGNDGELYWVDGLVLWRMQKNGADKEIALDDLYPSDMDGSLVSNMQCQLYSAGGLIFGNLHLIFDDCDASIYEQYLFTFNPVNGFFRKHSFWSLDPVFMVDGHDGNLYGLNKLIHLNFMDDQPVAYPDFSAGAAGYPLFQPLFKLSTGAVISLKIAPDDKRYIATWYPWTGAFHPLLPWSPELGKGATVAFSITAAASGSNAPTELSDALLVTPNPVRDVVRVTLKDPEAEEKLWTLFNTQGSKVLNGAFKGTAEMNLNSLPEGAYFLQIADGRSNIIGRKKIVKN